MWRGENRSRAQRGWSSMSIWIFLAQVIIHKWTPRMRECGAICRMRRTFLEPVFSQLMNDLWICQYFTSCIRGVYPPLGHGGTPPLSHRSIPPSEVFFSNPTIRGFGEHRKLPSGVWSGASATDAFGTFGMVSNWQSDSFSAGADPGIYFGGQTKVPNRKLRAKPESRARSALVSRGAKRSRIESEARTEGEAREKAGEGSGEGARWAPPQKFFEKSNLKSFILVHIWSNYLTWLTKWFNCPHSWKIIRLVIIWCDGNIKFCWSIKLGRGLGDEVPHKLKLCWLIK